MYNSASPRYLPGLVSVFQLIIPEWKCNAGLECGEVLCENPSTSWHWTNSRATMVSYFNLQCKSSYAYLASSLFFVPGSVIGLALSG